MIAYKSEFKKSKNNQKISLIFALDLNYSELIELIEFIVYIFTI